MKQSALQWKNAVKALRNADAGPTQVALLTACETFSFATTYQLKAYHDTLLFIVAFPFSKEAYCLAEKELHRLAYILRRKQDNPGWQTSFTGSGLPFTELHCQFSADMVAWLLQKFKGLVLPLKETSHNRDGDMELIWQAMLPGIEFYAATQERPELWSRVKQLSGHYCDEKALRWILQLFRQQKWDPLLKELLFNKLGIFIRWKITDPLFSRSFLRCPKYIFYCRNKTTEKVNSLAIIQQPVVKPIKLTVKERLALIDTIRTSLALYYRETDPVTFADASETSLFDMGNGLQIGLTGMRKEWRLALESYVGFMAFSNGVPVAYGGGWLFGHRCKIGVNIYPPFRGVVSSILFCEVMRLYYQVFRARYFVVKPYQFGKGNHEGLMTGAFWFYYKLGFRPVLNAINDMAGKEWEKIISGSQYRTPLPVLKMFTICNMEFEPVQSTAANINADRISKSVTDMICSRFSGNRKRAIEFCVEQFTNFHKPEDSGLEAIALPAVLQNGALLYGALPGTSSWTDKQRKQFLKLFQLKALGREQAYIIALQNHSGFWRAVQELCEMNENSG